MTYDYAIDLINTTDTVNGLGDSIPAEIKRTVFAALPNYRNRNYYEAMSSGLKPSITFVVNQYDYEGEEIIEHDGKQFKVIDVMPVTAKDESEFEAVSLLCEKIR